MMRWLIAVFFTGFVSMSAAWADEPVKCKSDSTKKECFNYIYWYWYNNSKQVVPVYGSTQAEADQHVREDACPQVGDKSVVPFRQIRRQKDGTVICQYGSAN